MTVTGDRHRVRRRSAARPEDRVCFSTSARTAPRRPPTRADGCSTASATTAASRWCWAARATRRSRSTSRRMRWPASRQNAARNGVAVDARVGNVFDELRGLDRLGERFDTIVLDPPAFAKNKAAVVERSRGLQGDQPARAQAAESGRHAGHLQLLVSTSTRRRSPRSSTRPAVDAQAHVTVVEKRMQGRDHPVLLGVPGDVLPEMLHPQKARVAAAATPVRGGARAARAGGMARPSGGFDSSRYFRGRATSGSTTSAPRRCASWRGRSTRTHQDAWSIDEAMAFADALIVGSRISRRSRSASRLVARYRRDFAPRLLPAWKRWLAGNHSANWATTDSICGVLIGPLLAAASRAGRGGCASGRAIATCGCGVRRSSG